MIILNIGELCELFKLDKNSRSVFAERKGIMNKLDGILEAIKVNELLSKKEEKKSPCKTILWIFAVIGAIAAVAGIAYAVYRYMTPDYLEDFDDDFDDEFEEDFFDDEEDQEEADAKEAAEE